MRQKNTTQRNYFFGLLITFLAATFGLAVFAQTTRICWRQELQSINRHFEQRPFLKWSKEGLERLNWDTLWQYHKNHEIPNDLWHWDYTLSWLIEPNHPPVMHKIVLFNHMIEDEPPLEAIEHFPWMKPLLQYPMSRGTIAEIVQFLGHSGAKLIVLDNDFPQFTPDDKKLAEAIHHCKVPVLMARTTNRRSSGHVLQLDLPTIPAGVLLELSKLEPNANVQEKYTGITGVLPDEDQIIRRLAARLHSPDGREHKSIVLKALQRLKEPIPNDVPDTMDIDFASPPNSELYPVRPQSYLLDPEKRKQMVHPSPDYHDVTLKDAIVFLGDSVTDIYSTPLTNAGLDEMSGSEILVHSLETIARKSWFQRLEDSEAIPYLFLVSLGGAVLWIIWKSLQKITDRSFQNLAFARANRLLIDVVFLFLLVGLEYFFACLMFVYPHIIVPVFVPTICIGFGAIAALMWEREREREDAFHTRVQATEDKLELAKQRYEADLKRQEAEAQSREVLMDRQRRKEFVRRINHDLNAPVSVLNWTLSELQEDGMETKGAPEKIARLVKNSDKLCELIDQLVQSYDYEAPLESGDTLVVCNLNDTIADTLDLQTPLAQLQGSKLEWTIPKNELFVKANKLELTRVIDNVVRNALKHNPPGTHVNVQVESHNGKHQVLVTDNGKGIDKEHISHIFEPGYRVNPDKKDGQGLGLDIVKTLIEKMGGSIAVESSIGKGTTFTISMPASEETTSNGHDGVDND